MSGIYMIVWNDTDKDKCRVLKPTKGGYPHITLAYTGKHLTAKDLKAVAAIIMNAYALTKVTLTKAYVNSFKPLNGPFRHDVLIEIKEEDMVEQARALFLRSAFPNSDLFSMHKPHVTHAIFAERLEAETVAEKLNAECLPLEVTITGVTID